MDAHTHDEPRSFDLGFRVAILIVSIAVIMRGVSIPGTTRVWFVACAAAYLVIGTVGIAWSERLGLRKVTLGLVFVLIMLAAVDVWLNHAAAMMLFWPLVSLMVLFASLNWAIALSVAGVLFRMLCGLLDGKTALDTLAGCVSFAAGTVFVMAFSRLLIKERTARHQLRQYSMQIEELATIKERNRVAREMHDGVGHCLTVVHVEIQAARALLERDAGGAMECLERAQKLAKEALAEVRRAVTVLRAGPLGGRPFVVALSSLLDDFRATGLDVTLSTTGERRALAPGTEFTLYRAAQEALTNIRRHAQASHARLTLRYDDAEVVFQIEDDGVGARAAEGGFGLTGLRERAELAGGSLEVHTATNQGFALTMRVPT